MKYLTALFAAAAIVGLASCGSGVSLPPVSPDDVEVFMVGAFPTEGYRVMARLAESMDLNTPDEEMIEVVKVKAAEMGADALIIDSLRRTTEGGVETDLRQEQRKIIEARAVYFPARHPELQR
jgi:ABC-type glycerol-3-phosphate transport system substrate-binding protein